MQRPSVLLFIALMMQACLCSAQRKETDSLLAVLKSRPQKDTARINLLNKLSNSLVNADYKKGLLYNDTAIALAQSIGTRSQLAEAWLIRSDCLSTKNDFNDALRLTNEALKIFTSANNSEKIADCYLSLAFNNYGIANYAIAISWSKKALQTAQKTSNKILLAKCYNSLATNYTNLANYTEAAKYLFQELKIYEALHNKMGIAKAYGNMGVVYYGLKKYPEAIDYTQRALILLKQLDEKLHAAAALNNIGGYYLAMGNYKQAINYNEQALAYNKIVSSRKGTANDLMDIGVAYYHLQQYPKAISYLNQSIAVYDTLGAKNNLSQALGHLATLYVNVPAAELTKIGLKPVARYSKALELQTKAVKLAQQSNDRSNESTQWQKLSDIYRLQNSYKQAFESYQTYVRLRDSIINDKKQQEITRLSMQYDFDKKEAAIKIDNERKEALAQLEISRQKFIRNALIVVGFVVIIAAIFIFVFYERRKRAIELQKEAELQARISDTEMKALRLQLNPHFIFNSLNSISYYINRHDKETADIYLTKFARLMRLVLENSEYTNVSLRTDIQTLELYMQMEALRLEKKFTYHISIDDEVDPDNTLVPPMVMQPFVENSIWHGIAPKTGKGKIEIEIKRENELLRCIITDDGVGRQIKKRANDVTVKKSLGIKVIQARIDVINETAGAKAGVEIIDLEDGTQAVIILPYQINF